MAAAIVNRRVITGWRSSSINETLDKCSVTEDYLELYEVGGHKKIDKRGRHSKMYEDQNAGARARYHKNPEKQKEKLDNRMKRYRSDYELFCSQFKLRFPDENPVTFSRFWKTDIRVNWLENPESVIEQTRHFAVELEKKKRDAQKKFLGKDTFNKK